MADKIVELGFLQECEPWQVESRLFPSKVGGKPAWLNLENLPTAQRLQCNKCQQTMIFLCQVYAPFEDDTKHALDQYVNNFHRTIFIFICRNEKCCVMNDSSNVKVLRSCLKRDNKFYSYQPAEEKPDPDFSLNKWANLCNLCGCLSEKQCGKCRQVYYCSKGHQIFDWKESHKRNCLSDSNEVSRFSKKLFIEWEIITETEELENANSSEADELKKFEQLKAEGKTGTMSNLSEEDLEILAAREIDEVFDKFEQRVSHYLDQVIRYKRGGQPLWLAKKPLPEVIPNCEYCNGPRIFEFQIMPQMLSLLVENDIDWGVMAVYTCLASCTQDDSYKEEFVFKQDVEYDKV